MPKRINAALKTKIALEALQGHHTVPEIASKYGVHPNLVTRVKKEAAQNLSKVFDQGEDARLKELEKEKDELLHLVGEKERDIKWLKKKCKQLGLL
ncbi:MAG: transposase [Spirochaetes bacterium]|nr:transposase [Spirochaetota bacterium]